MDLEQKAIERIRLASDLSLKHYGKPLVCEYSGGKDSDVLLQLFRMAEIPFEVHNSHTTVDAPQTVRHRHQWIKYHHHRRGWVYKCIICGKLCNGR